MTVAASTWSTWIGLVVSCVALVGLQAAVFRRSLAKAKLSDLSHAPSLARALGVVWMINALVLRDLELIALHSVGLIALSYGYYHFLNMCRTARRIRLLTEVYEAGGSIPTPDLLKRYSGREMLVRRAARMIQAGQVVQSGDSHTIVRTELLRSARTMRLLKRFFGLLHHKG